jgi:hypothetical protein
MTPLVNTSALLFPLYVVSPAFQYSLIMSHQGSHGSLKFLNTSICTCHNLLTPVALHILTNADASVLTSVGVKPLVDHNLHFEAVCYVSSQELRLPTACTILCVRFTCFVRIPRSSATSATLDTGGWLGLARQGLSPCKMHQD